MRKKKIVFHSDFSLAKTGFGRNAKALLSYLYKTGKYDIVHYSCHVVDVLPDLAKTPWKSVGAMPYNQQEVNSVTRNAEGGDKERIIRSMWYGAYNLDKVILSEKPDFYFGVQDIWGVDYSIDKPWFNKINSVIWTTLDSLPLLPNAVSQAPKIKNYWMWSSFATDEMHRLGHNHVKTVHGAIDTSFFYPFNEDRKLALRNYHNIESDRFLIGFVFRNQLRKSIPNLIAGYKIWKDKNPNQKSGLLLHTCFSEGWNIPSLASQNGVDLNDIYATYVCRNCSHYHVRPFDGEEKACRACNQPKSMCTANLSNGVTENELNEVYNLMNVYCHPFTSGGQEIPIQEAKLAGLITLVTNYSCGVEMCKHEACSIPLEWEEYREFETQFIKATTLKESIADSIQLVYTMSKDKKDEMSRLSRIWAVENFSINSIGKQIEEFLDSQPEIDWDSKVTIVPKNPIANINQGLRDSDYVKELYKNILIMDIDESDSGYQHWMHQLSNGVPRQTIEQFFRETADNENKKQIQSQPVQSEQKNGIEAYLDANDEGKRILYVIPNGIGDAILSTSLFKSIKDTYPEFNLYVATEKPNFDVFVANPYIHKIIPYSQELDNLLYLEGIGNHKGFFEIAFLPFLGTQRMLNWVHNGKTRIAYQDLRV